MGCKVEHGGYPAVAELYYIFDMANVNCPDCGARAVRVSLTNGYKFYCSQCAWNREIARVALAFATRTSLFVATFGLILAVVIGAKNPGEKWAAVPILLAFSALPSFYVVSARLQLRKLNRLSLQPTSQYANSVLISNTTPSPASDPKAMRFREKDFPELAVIPRPRKLKTTWKGRGYWAFAVVGVGLYTVYGLPAAWREFRVPHSWNGNDLMLVIPVAMVYGWFFIFLRNRIRERQLLANGELTTGYVTAQRNGRYIQTVDYCFRRAGGELVTSRCHDASRSLFEGMTVPVFYDAHDPQRSVPLECSMTTIAAS
jgi:hypothetical protein